jgi:asparagine synthase (glutamine-hydrolysing)
MCGIAGTWHFGSRSAEAIEADLRAMTAVLRHRGPDDEGIWVDSETGIGFGFRRLSILDLSPTGRQPMRSADGRYRIIFNGEVYNYRELAQDLRGAGVRTRGTSDTEVLLEAIACWGFKRALARAAGMFAFALWDEGTHSLLLVRDRLGKKPVYYFLGTAEFIFASELKAIVRHSDFRPEINREALTLFMRYGYVPSPYTIYTGVRKLEPGQYVTIRPDRSAVAHEYWSITRVVAQAAEERHAIDEDAAVDEFERLLRDATSTRMIADVPLGAFLSGGIDSSVVVALMQSLSRRPIQTYTAGFEFADYDEAGAARRVAQHVGTQHHEMRVTARDAMEVVPRLPDLYDEPFADASQIPTFLIFQHARRDITVGLSGDGGDELFAGYERHLYGSELFKWKGRLPRAVWPSLGRAIRSIGPGRIGRAYAAASGLLPVRHRHRRVAEKLEKLARALDEGDVRDLYRRLLSHWPDVSIVGGSGESATRLDAAGASGLRDPAEQMMFFDYLFYLPEDILTKVDRASMGVSLEVRSPLLDHRVVEWVWRLPVAYKYRRTRSKWLLRRLLERYVPPVLTDRPKSGFSLPLGAWLTGPLRGWAEDLLAEDRMKREGYVDGRRVRTIWQAHLDRRGNYEQPLWNVLMFECWLQRWAA